MNPTTSPQLAAALSCSDYRPAGSAVPAVAIITPYYNTGALFVETIQSVFAQTLQQWEWLIVNDGSTDPAALALLEPLRTSGDARMHVIDQPNRGLPAARNAGVAASSAPLLFFLDSDDLLEPTALEKLAWLLQSDPRPAFATSWIAAFGAQEFYWSRGFETRELFLFENTVTALAMVRRTVFEAVGGFDQARVGGLEDYAFWLACAAQNHWGRDIPEFLIRQRYKTAQQYRDYSWPQRDDPARFGAFQREMRARYPHLYRQGLPHLPPAAEHPLAPIPQALPFTNSLLPLHGRRLLLLPQTDLVGDALLEQLSRLGYHCTVCITTPAAHPLLAELQRYAPVFVLDRFLRPGDYPRFLHYLVQSRQIDALLIGNSVFAQRILPYLRVFCPDVALLSYSYLRDPAGADQAAPGFCAESYELPDLHLAGSDVLRNRLVARGVPPERIVVLGQQASQQDSSAQSGPRLAALIDATCARRRAQPPALSLDAGLAAATLAVAELRRQAGGHRESAEWRLARERLILANAALYMLLRSYRLKLVRHPSWKLLAPLWRRLRGNLRLPP